MSLVLPHSVLWSQMPWRRQLVLAAALAVRGDASTRQIQKKVRLRRATIFAELDALERDGFIVRDRGKSSSNKHYRITGRVTAVSATLAGEGWTAIPASKYDHYDSADLRWNELLVASTTRSGTILSTTKRRSSTSLASATNLRNSSYLGRTSDSSTLVPDSSGADSAAWAEHLFEENSEQACSALALAHDETEVRQGAGEREQSEQEVSRASPAFETANPTVGGVT